MLAPPQSHGSCLGRRALVQCQKANRPLRLWVCWALPRRDPPASSAARRAPRLPAKPCGLSGRSWGLGTREPRPGGLNCDPSSQPHVWGTGLGGCSTTNLRLWESRALRLTCREVREVTFTQSRSAPWPAGRLEVSGRVALGFAPAPSLPPTALCPGAPPAAAEQGWQHLGPGSQPEGGRGGMAASGGWAPPPSLPARIMGGLRTRSGRAEHRPRPCCPRRPEL